MKPTKKEVLEESDILKMKCHDLRAKFQDPEFQKKYEEKRAKVTCLVWLIRFFCCPCIVLCRF